MSESFINNYYVANLLDKSGGLNGEWEIILVAASYEPNKIGMLHRDALPSEVVLGSSKFVVALDREYACVNSAQEQIIFRGCGHLASKIGYMLLADSNGLIASGLGSDLTEKLLRSEARNADLVVTFGEDRTVFGL